MVNIELTNEQAIELVTLLDEQTSNLYNKADRFQNEKLQQYFVGKADILHRMRTKILNSFINS